MSLPKKELPVWLTAETHAKLKAYSDIKGSSMKEIAEVWITDCLNRKFDEAVSFYKAVVSAGIDTSVKEHPRKGDNFKDSLFTDGVQQ